MAYKDLDNLEELRFGFKEFLNKEYSHLVDKSVIYSDAFYIFRYDIGINPKEVLVDIDAFYKCKELLFKHFEKKGRKNPKSDAGIYCTAIKLLREYIKEIPTPSKKEIEKYLSQWEELENYKFQENVLSKLFGVTYPNNNLIEDILVKVSTLNDFYSTNIFACYEVAKRIKFLDIDKRLKQGDESLVNDIAKVIIKDKTKNFYSFATKYCSHHNPEEFPIYDSYVDDILKYFKKEDGFCEFSDKELKEYKVFKSTLRKFRKYYKLEAFSLKDIDKYLWQLGKEKFPKNYQKKI